MDAVVKQLSDSIEFLTNVLGADHAETKDAVDQKRRVVAKLARQSK